MAELASAAPPAPPPPRPPPHLPDTPAAIVAALARRDYAACLGLPPVTLDELGAPAWSVTDAELSRAYRQRCLRHHPDKSSAAGARAAFDALNAAHKALQDAAARTAWLREAGVKLTGALGAEGAARVARTREAAAASDYAAAVRAQAARAAARAQARKAAAAVVRPESSSESSEVEREAATGRGAAVLGKRGRGRGRPCSFTL